MQTGYTLRRKQTIQQSMQSHNLDVGDIPPRYLLISKAMFAIRQRNSVSVKLFIQVLSCGKQDCSHDIANILLRTMIEWGTGPAHDT